MAQPPRASLLSTFREATTLAPMGMAPDLLAQVPRRLTWGALGACVMFTALLATEPLRPAAAVAGWTGPASAAVGMALSLATAWIAGSRKLSLAVLSDLALVFQVGIGIVIWVMELSVPFANTTHTPGIPTVAGWMLFFPALVPLPVRTSTTGTLLITLAGPLVMMAFVLAGQPAPNPTHAGLWFTAAAVAGAMSVVTASVLQRAFLGLRRARARDQYELVRRLGRGGMGEVYVARHERLARLAAVKTIRPDALAGAGPAAWEKLTKRFEQEARITARLRSPHTVELYDHGVTEDGTLYYAMELLDGLDLEDLVERFGPLPPRRVVHLLLHACDSLAEAHEQGLVHRDIKPSNLFTCRLGVQHDVLKVLDFGTVKEVATRPEDGLTHEGQYVGTPAFSSPEALVGAVDARSDLYALGCVAWWLLTGDHVFPLTDASEVLLAHRDEPVPPLSDATPLPVPADLEAVVAACLSKHPMERPQTARELATRLRAVDLPPWTPEHAERWWNTHLPDDVPRVPRSASHGATPTWPIAGSEFR